MKQEAMWIRKFLHHSIVLFFVLGSIQWRLAYAVVPGTTLWSIGVGAQQYERGSATAFDLNGNAWIAGSIQSSVDFGGGPVPCTGTGTAFLAKYNSGGAYQWAGCFPGRNTMPNAIATDRWGNVLMTGYFQNTVQFGSIVLNGRPGANVDVFVVKFNPNGTLVWAKAFGGDSDDTALSIAVDSSGNVFVAGAFRGTVDFGTALLTSSPLGVMDAFLLKLTAFGNPIWAKNFTNTSTDLARSVAVDVAGNPVITGQFWGRINLGGSRLTSAGGGDLFIGKFNGSTGAHLWSKAFGGKGDDSGNGVAVDQNSGLISVTGSFQSSVTFGSTALSANGTDGYVVQVSGSDASPRWATRIGGVGADSSNAIAVDSGGGINVGGVFASAIDLGGVHLSSRGGVSDAYVLKLSSTGSALWGRSFGSADLDAAYSIAVDSLSNVCVTGEFGGIVDFGTGPVASQGGRDIFVGKLTP